MYNIVLTVNKMYKVIKNVDFLREVLGLLGHWSPNRYTTGINWDCPTYWR